MTKTEFRELWKAAEESGLDRFTVIYLSSGAKHNGLLGEILFKQNSIGNSYPSVFFSGTGQRITTSLDKLVATEQNFIRTPKELQPGLEILVMANEGSLDIVNESEAIKKLQKDPKTKIFTCLIRKQVELRLV